MVLLSVDPSYVTTRREAESEQTEYKMDKCDSQKQETRWLLGRILPLHQPILLESNTLLPDLTHSMR
jgi:hypothetical protein